MTSYSLPNLKEKSRLEETLVMLIVIWSYFK